MRLITGYLGEIFILLTCHNRLRKFRVRLITECCIGVGDQIKSLVLSNELINVELPPDVSSVSPSSERIKEFWVVVVYMRV